MIVIPEPAFWTMVTFMLNATVGFCISAFIWYWIRNQHVKKKMDEAITDGDNIVHTQDARNTLAMFWSVMFAWGALNVWVGGLIYQHEYTVLGGTVFGAAAVLLALKKL